MKTKKTITSRLNSTGNFLIVLGILALFASTFIGSEGKYLFSFYIAALTTGIGLKMVNKALKEDFIDKLDLQQMDAKEHAYWVECIVVVDDRKVKSVIIQRGKPLEIDLERNLRPDASILVGESIPESKTAPAEKSKPSAE